MEAVCRVPPFGSLEKKAFEKSTCTSCRDISRRIQRILMLSCRVPTCKTTYCCTCAANLFSTEPIENSYFGGKPHDEQIQQLVPVDNVFNTAVMCDMRLFRFEKVGILNLVFSLTPTRVGSETGIAVRGVSVLTTHLAFPTAT